MPAFSVSTASTAFSAASASRRTRRGATTAAISASILIGAVVLTPAVAGAASVPPAEVVSPPSAPDVVDLGITDVLALLESGASTSVALTQEYLDRIAAYDNPYGIQPGLAAVVLANPRALATAAELDEERAAGVLRGPLHGVPILVKDNYATFDMPTTAGSASLHTYQTKVDATAVQRLRDAGAIILAKTNLSEFAWHGTYTLSSERGRTNNPYNQANSASGSSGGTAAAVAASYAPAGLGTDSCGSIVGPSAHQSLVGYRPTMGLTSVAGIVPLSLRQDVSGPMTKTVTDAAILMEVLAGFDPADSQTVIANEQSTDNYVEGLSDTSLEGKRIGYVDWEFTEDPARPGLAETTALVDQAVADLAAQGATIVSVPFTREFVSDVLKSGGWIDMRPSIDSYFATTEATWPDGLAALTEPVDALTFSDVIADGKSSMTQGDIDSFMSNEDVPNPAYDTAVAEQDAGKAAMDQFFVDNNIDALAMPTSATSASPDWAGTTFCDVGANTGIPTVSLPAGFTSTGAAVGLELAAPRSQDAELLSMSYDYEQATQHRVAPSSTPELVHTVAVGTTDPASPDLAVVDPAGTLPPTGASQTVPGVFFGLVLLVGGAAAMVFTQLARRRTRSIPRS
jgi:amidase